MDESRPATAAPPDDPAAAAERAPPEEKPARRRLHVPTSVLVTVLVATLSVWVAPALTRQWDDRQKARDLKVSLAQEISTGTARTLGDGIAAAMVGDDVRPILTAWEVARLNVEAKLRLYFGDAITQRWHDYSTSVRMLVRTFQLNAPLLRAIAQEHASRVERAATYNSLTRSLGEVGVDRDDALWDIPRLITSPIVANRDLGTELLKTEFLRRADVLMTDLLRSHPAGFSTTRGDLLHDLLP
jgi:hypothetical protein